MRAIAAIVLMGALCSLPAGTATAESASASEAQIKAVFLFNFARFVTWPEASRAQRSDPFWICVWGPDPFGAALDAVVENEAVGGQPIRIQRSDAAQELRRCRILFVAGSAGAETMGRLLSELRDSPVLTVGDTPDFLDLGGMIRFVDRNNRIGLAINPRAAERVKLKISSRLLSLAEIEEIGTANAETG